MLVLLYAISCTTENSTEPESEIITFNAYQDGGCNYTTLAKTTLNDSCFSYSFEDTLKIDFCVIANCYPDSSRFVIDYDIHLDTIFVSVADTAESICHCICNYTIHLDLVGLSQSQYFFSCDYNDTTAYNEQIIK